MPAEKRTRFESDQRPRARGSDGGDRYRCRKCRPPSTSKTVPVLNGKSLRLIAGARHPCVDERMTRGGPELDPRRGYAV